MRNREKTLLVKCTLNDDRQEADLSEAVQESNTWKPGRS